MFILLSKIEQVFQFNDLGCIIVPGIPTEIKNRCKLKVGDEIELRFPDGKVMSTKIASINMVCGTPSPPPIPLMLPKEIKKNEIEIGTEVWIDESKIDNNNNDK